MAQERQSGSASSSSPSPTTSSLEGDTPEDGEIWAHSIPRPERGSLLLAHPQMFEQSQQYFHQAAILLLDHDDATGSFGVILNRPSDYRLGQLVLTKELLGAFDSCRLYMGGDVGDNSLQVIHAVPGVQGGAVDA